MKEFIAKMVEGQNETNPALEDYAFLYSKSYGEIFGYAQNVKPEKAHKSYLKLTHGRYSIYLRFKALNGTKEDEVKLTYTNLCRLGIDLKIREPEPMIKISPDNWINYNMHHQDDGRKWLFIFGFFGFIIALVITIISFVVTISN